MQPARRARSNAWCTGGAAGGSGGGGQQGSWEALPGHRPHVFVSPSTSHTSPSTPVAFQGHMVCSCGKCIAGCLSPRMSLRLQRTADSSASMIVDSVDWPGERLMASARPCKRLRPGTLPPCRPIPARISGRRAPALARTRHHSRRHLPHAAACRPALLRPSSTRPFVPARRRTGARPRGVPAGLCAAGAAGGGACVDGKQGVDGTTGRLTAVESNAAASAVACPRKVCSTLLLSHVLQVTRQFVQGFANCMTAAAYLSKQVGSSGRGGEGLACARLPPRLPCQHSSAAAGSATLPTLNRCWPPCCSHPHRHRRASCPSRGCWLR